MGFYRAGWRNFLAALIVCSFVNMELKARPLPAQAIDDQPTSGAAFFPESTVVYAELRRPAGLLNELLNHPLRGWIEKLALMQEVIQDPKLIPVPIVVAALERKTGLQWPELVETLGGNGAYFGLDPASESAALLIHSRSEKTLSQSIGLLLGLVESEAKKSSKELPFAIGKYRSHKFAKFDGGVIARCNEWLIASNKQKLAKAIVDNLIDHPEHSLSNMPRFKQAAGHNRDADFWAFVDTPKLREANVAPRLLGGATDDVGAELLIGGMLEILNKSAGLVVTADLQDHRFILDISAPVKPAQLNPDRSFFFGEDGSAAAPVGLAIDQPLLNITAFRDIAAWWNSKEELFEENVVAELAQADSELSTLFAGLSFGEEVLGGLAPGIQVVARQQQFESDYRPDVQLPEFAAIGQLKDPQLARRLRIAWQSVIGFANIELGMNGQPQLESSSETVDGAQVMSTRYFVDEESPKGMLLYNFSPTLVFHDQQMIVSSTKRLADDLLASVRKSGKSGNALGKAARNINTMIAANGDQLHSLLIKNREALVVQNMLDEGSSRRKSERTIDGLLEIVDLIQSAKATLGAENDKWDLQVNVEFKSEK